MSIPPAYVPTEFEPLGQAIYRGNFDAVQNLLQRGVNPNSYLVNGARMLSVAVESGNMEIIKLLLEFGALPCCKDPGLPSSPLERAARKSEMEVIRAMLLTDCEVDSCITLRDVVFYRKEVVELLIPLVDKSRFYLTNAGGQTVLHLAMRDAYALLEAGAAVNITLPHGGQNALHVALKIVAASELPPILCELLRYGADVNGMSPYGTPMHCAVRTRARSIVEVLLRESLTPPDLTIQDSYGQTAMESAFQLGYDEIGNLLKEYQ
ncbi:Ankyrin-1 [Penicillium subrubescens]|uniref:Ankyrin-1 n=2 Tax=Penicillium subrubescens TaxID=1316194 RepID=A0A1Q5TI26_9EURO|nr:Ankyrin-1 [Penicillium subrubescens]